MLKRILHLTSIAVILVVILLVNGCGGMMGSQNNMDDKMKNCGNNTHHASGNSDASKTDNSEKQ
jgi:hypothetical protein